MKMFKSSKWFIILAIVASLVVLGAAGAFAAPKQKNIILATTTSTQDSGLLDTLIPIFEKETGYFMKTIAVGSGQAMKMGKKARPTSCWFIHRTPRKNLSKRATGSTAAW